MAGLRERHLILRRLMLGDQKRGVGTSEWLCFEDLGDTASFFQLVLTVALCLASCVLSSSSMWTFATPSPIIH